MKTEKRLGERVKGMKGKAGMDEKGAKMEANED